jgi:hypothetical protein
MLRLTSVLVILTAACSSASMKGAGTGNKSDGGNPTGDASGTGGGGPGGGAGSVGGGPGGASGDGGNGPGNNDGGNAGAGGSGGGGAGGGGASGAGGGGPSAYDACMQLQALTDTFIGRCFNELPGYYKTLTVPTARCAAVASSVAAGRITYDASQLATCLSRLGNQTCAQWYDDQIPICTMMTGTVGDGGACHSYGDCNNGLCLLGDACPGVCHAYVGVGGACDNKTKFCDPRTSTCGSGSTCVALTHPALGAACGQEGAYCNPAVAWCDTTNHCVALRTSGACTISTQCALGYLCAGPKNATTCQPAVGLAGGCTPGYSQCQFPGACDASTQTCVERRTGDPCGQITLPENQVCLESSCIYQAKTSGTCVAKQQDGQSCGTASTPTCLASSTCRAGTCSPTECP